MFLSMFLYTLFFSLTPMIAIYVPKLTIDAIQAQQWQSILLILIGGFALSAFCTFMTEYLKGNYRMRFNAVRYKLIEQLNLATMTMAYSQTEDPDVLDQLRTISRTLLNPHIGPGGIMEKLLSIFGSIVGVVGLAVVISTLNIWVLLLLLGSIILTYILSLRAGQYEEKLSVEYDGAWRRHDYATATAGDFRFGKDIRMYQLGGLLKAKRDEETAITTVLSKAIANHKWGSEAIIALIGLLRDLLMYGYITSSFLQGGLNAGNFFLYTGSVTTIVFWLSDTLRDLGFIQVHSKYVRKYQSFINDVQIPDDSGLPVTAHLAGFDIEFKDVSFKYPGSEKLILEHLNLNIPYGERLALVGENGAGKTTLVKLLTRLYEPTSGLILLNGRNIQEYDYFGYQDLISTILQDAKVFPFKLAENIALEKEIDAKRLSKAIKASGLAPFIDSLNDGVDTWLLKILNENGIDLSGGQRQKLFLARALYEDRPFIILDEPTAALDPLAEYEMYQSFDQTIEDKSAIYISHRLSSTRFCDHVAFLENGKITEYGTHDSLLRQGGSYAELFEIQAQYYREKKMTMEGENHAEEL